MKRSIAFLIVLLPPPAAARPVSAGDCPAPVLGIWEYRQAAGEGVDAEGERLELACQAGALRGLYFGLEREGEEGLFYTLVEVRSLNVTPPGEISFVVPEREVYQTRPRSLQEVEQKRLPSSGITRDELHFQGRIANQRLVLACTARMGTCPDRTMVFQRTGSGGTR